MGATHRVGGLVSADEKIKTAADKVPLNLVPLRALKGVARVFGYGAKKYSAGNYYTADDAEIANRYVGGFLRHLSDCQRPDGLFDWSSVAQLDAESGLPEIDHAICGLVMLRALAIKHGALPADPGQGNKPTTVAERKGDDELSTERLLREARVASGAYDVAVRTRPTGPGETGRP